MLLTAAMGYYLNRKAQRAGFAVESGGAAAVPSTKLTTAYVAVGGLVQSLLWMLAAYLSFRRNGGFNLGSQVAATCCTTCYLLYALAVPVKTPGPAPARVW